MAVLINNGKGTVKIPNRIIGEVAYTAAKECGGVAEITNGSSKSKRGVRIGVKDGGLEISLGVVMRYGVSVSDINAEMVSHIKERVTEFTGVENLKLFVNVESVSF